ncbi:Asp-tRNA(Asn)/Glu-tRNA(Gln) amidotransferase subunit GatA, partial [Patescibacteria group bacterium]|nr:Asp-tRNA(Asn)/Glu-tRNA(Gln) amidotransferase subunit GatA [Patescibacteria group bacterium]
MDLKSLTIKKTQELIKNKETTIRELVSAYQENIKNKNKDLNAYLEIFEDAFVEAEKQDKEILEGNSLKPLSGISFAIKDNILIKGKICSASSKMLENYHATYDASVIKKLKNAGAIFLGRTNMDEFAMGASTENSAFGPTKNPYDLERVAGGSSGGSAA